MNGIDKKGKKKKKTMKNLISNNFNFINSKLLFIIKAKNVNYYYESYTRNLIAETLWLTTIFFLRNYSNEVVVLLIGILKIILKSTFKISISSFVNVRIITRLVLVYIDDYFDYVI